MAGPLDGIDLGAPAPADSTASSSSKKPAATGPLAGVDLSAAPSTPATAQPAANPFLNVTGPWNAPKDQPLGQMALWNKPSDISWGQYAGAHLQPLDDMVRSSTNAFGVGDYVASLMDRATGRSPATPADLITRQGQPMDPLSIERAHTAEVEARMPAQNRAAAAVLGYAPVAAEGFGVKLADLMGGGRLASMGGSAIENAAANSAGSYGRGESWGNIAKAGLTGLGTGFATGAIPGQKGTMADTPSPTADLQDTAKQTYASLTKAYQTPDVEKAISNVEVPQGLQSKMSNSMSDQIDRLKGILAKGGQTTANDIADFRASLMGAAKNSTDQAIAGQYLDALDKGVGTVTANAIKEANTASGVAKTSSDIDNWMSAVQKNPAKTQDAIEQALKDNPSFYGNARPMLQEAVNAKPGFVRSLMTGKVVPAALNAGVDAGAAYIAGGNPLVGAVTGGLSGAIFGHGVSQQRSSDLAARLAAARHFNATGQKISPNLFNQGIPVLGPLAAGVQQGTTALGASGMYPANQQQ